MAGLELSKAEEERILRGVLDGSIGLFTLPISLYEKYGEHLTDSVLEGFKLPKDTDLTAPDMKTPRTLKKNVYQFSAAKTFNNVQDLQNFIFDDDGNKRSFPEFKKEAQPFFEIHNESFLETEAFTAQRMAEGANEWDQIKEEEDTFPFLRYETVQDSAVRPDHADLQGVVKRVDDPFWDVWMPPNGWNCRCFVTQVETGRGGKRNFTEPPIEPMFEGNPGKSGKAFKKTHPYYKVAKEFNTHKKNNFGMPLPPDVTD